MARTTNKRIVCLANSRKLNGRCVAGKEILSDGRIGGWVRPVSNRPNEEVSASERHYEDGTDPAVLDVLDLPLIRAHPKNYQQENWLLDPNRNWKKVESLGWGNLRQLIDPLDSLWLNGFSSANGLNDRFPIENSGSVQSSLRLIAVPKLELFVTTSKDFRGNLRQRVQGRLLYGGTDYWLRVTDPEYELNYSGMPDGQYSLGNCLLTISLGEPFEGFAYKLIAAIIEP